MAPLSQALEKKGLLYNGDRGIHDMANAIQGSSVHAVVLGFAKAFEKVPHRRLLGKLQYYGIHGPLLKWLESFLTQRSQLVVCEGQSSCPSEVISGVPQGTVHYGTVHY